MDIDLTAVKSYCRIDGSEEDALLLDLIAAAREYLDGAGIPDPEADNPLYSLAVKALVLDYYDHRGTTEAANVSAIPGMENAIVQLKLQTMAERIVGDA